MDSKNLNPCVRIGILGGGQLSQMLCEAATRLPIRVETVVLSTEPTCPAASTADHLLVGSVSADSAPLHQLLGSCSFVLFENEFVDCNVLRLANQNHNTPFFPSLQAIEVLQNKLTQKETLSSLQILTSPFIELRASNLTNDLEAAVHTLGPDLVLKWANLGYDGGGVTFFSSPKPFAIPFETQTFCSRAFERGHRVYAEKRVNFKRELALVAVANQKHEVALFPIVETIQTRGICEWAFGTSSLSPSIIDSATFAARTLARHLNLVGTFAIEFFETHEGQLLVNEIAPRVHNSGHITQDSCNISQFTAHLLSTLGTEIPSIRPNCGSFVMKNLLGPSNLQKSFPAPLRSDQLFTRTQPSIQLALHWYNKIETRPGRKLGHINATSHSPQTEEELKLHLHNATKLFETWAHSLN